MDLDWCVEQDNKSGQELCRVIMLRFALLFSRIGFRAVLFFRAGLLFWSRPCNEKERQILSKVNWIPEKTLIMQSVPPNLANEGPTTWSVLVNKVHFVLYLR